MVSEVLKWRLNRRQSKDIYFWRDSNGQEIDLLIEENGSLLPIECKAGQTIAAHCFGSIEKFLDVTGSNQAWLIYGGDQTQQRKRLSVLGWQGLAAAMDLRSGSPGENVRTRVGFRRGALQSPPFAARNWAGVTMRKPDLAYE